ncbi:MAG: crossover junction endodeoxyribonuclease RuvC [SAR324 cluster bacterium]|nr:crossover junction endodeoxyribonuclease RuvC [SAR324 cluster bacterium]
MNKRILGIDPGSQITGIGIVDVNDNDNDNIKFVHSEIIDCRKITDLGSKLKKIFDCAAGIVEEYQPQVAILEKIFFAVNAKTALLLGHARGAVMASIQTKEIQIFEYSPKEIKLALIGEGGAHKFQINMMVKLLLNIKDKEISFDESDALAAAICHINHHSWLSKLSR